MQANHLSQFPEERDVISAFVDAFDVNWARHRSAYNTKLSCYIMDPKAVMKELFGFSSEVVLFITPFDDIQPRSFQAIFQFLYEEPIRGRVDKSLFFLMLPSGQSKELSMDIYNNIYSGQIPIMIQRDDLTLAKREQWGLQNLIAKEIFSRDLFDFQLPLKDDYGFFGREALVFDFSEAVAKGQNRGLFGLRKTGKTSLLFKIRRNLDNRNNIKTLYYDCKKTRLRNKSSEELISEICYDVLKAFGAQPVFCRSLSSI